VDPSSVPASVLERRRATLTVEVLEDRTLLAWSAIGPAPQLDPSALFRAPPQAYSGRISALATAGDFTSGSKLCSERLGAVSGQVLFCQHGLEKDGY